MNVMRATGVGCAVSLAAAAWAADVQKEVNGVPLNAPASWVGGGVPGPVDKAVFGVLDEDLAVAFGADAAWRGIVVANTTNAWTLTGPATLALGADGFSTDGNLTLDDTVTVALSASQAWRIGTQARRVCVNGPIQGPSTATLTKTGLSTLVLPVDNPFEGAFQLGGTGENNNTANTSANLLSATASSGGFIAVGANGSLGRGILRCRGTQIIASVPGLVIPNDGLFDSGSLRAGGTNDITFSGAFTLVGAGRDLGNYMTAGHTLTLTGPISIAGYTLTLRSAASVANAIVLAGPLLGSGQLVLDNTDFGGSTAYLTADNTAFTGSSEIKGGTLAVVHPNAVGGGSVTLNGDNTQLALADGIVFTNTVIIRDGGGGPRILRPLDGASAEFAGPIINMQTTADRGRFSVGAGETLTVSGPITTASAGISKLGVGVLVLPNAQTFTNAFLAGNGTTGNTSPTLDATANSGGTIIIGHSEAFGRGTLRARGAQIRAAVPGLVVTNDVSLEYGSLRFNGEHDLTFSGPMMNNTAGQNRDIANYSRTRTLSLTGPVSILTNTFINIVGINNAPANGTTALLGPVEGPGYIVVNDAFGNGLLILGGANTFTGRAELGNGTVRLDYTAQDNSKLSDTAPLQLNGVTAIELSGGTHLERVASTSVSRPAAIRRLSGSAILALGDITFAVGGALHLAEPGIASTTSTNVNGILPNVTVALPDGTTALAAVSADPDGAGGFLIAAAILPFSAQDDIPHLGGILPDDPTLNARIVDGGTGAEVTATELTNTVNTVTVAAAESPTRLALDADALLTAASVTLAPDAADFTLGDAPSKGRFTSPTSTLALINNTTAATLRVNAAIINRPAAGNVTLVKRGPGTVLFAGANTFSAGLVVEEGMLQIGDGGTTGAWGSNLGYVRNNGTLRFNIGGSSDQTISANITGAGRFIKDGSFTQRLTGQASTFSGGTEVNGGTLYGEDSGSDDMLLNLGSGPIAVNGARLFFRVNGSGSNRTIVSGDGYTPSDLTFTGATVTLDVNRQGGNNTNNTVRFGAVTLASPSFTFASANGYSAAFAGPATLLTSVTFTASSGNPNAELRFNSPLDDGGQGFGFTKSGVGVLALNGDNAISGQVTLGTTTSVSHGPNDTLNTAGGVVAVGHDHAFGAGPLLLRGAQIRASRPGLVITNAITIEGGGFRVGGTNDLAFTGPILITGSTRGIGNYTINRTLTVGAIDLNGYGLNLEGISGSTSNGTILVRGPIVNTGSGSSAVTVHNSFVGGTAVFTATNTYTGATSIEPGTTLVLGDGGTSGSLNLASTISNSGTLAFNRADALTQGVHFATALGITGGISQRGTGRVVITSGLTCSGTVHVAESAVLELSGAGLPHPSSLMKADGTFAFARTAETVFSNTVSGAGCIAIERGAVSFMGDLSAFTGLVRVHPGATLAAGEPDLPALTFGPGATCRWNITAATNDIFTVTGDLTLPAGGIAFDLRRPDGSRPNPKGRILFAYGGTYDGPAECPCGTAYVAVHDPGTKTLRIKQKFDGLILIVK